jgi:glycosyltransferase involved in cell wall biosynthesis
VAPSVVPETFGVVIAEAYAYGLPVITSTAGAFPEIVREGETGFLVKPGSVEELYSAMLKVSEGHLSLNTMSQNCLEEAQKYTSEKFVSAFLDIYET